MRRLAPLIAAMMFVVMLWSANVAHAAEAIGCVEVTAGTGGHSDGGQDDVPQDTGKAVPHHHSGCHGHHVAIPGDLGPTTSPAVASISTGPGLETMNASHDPGISLRPPIA